MKRTQETGPRISRVALAVELEDGTTIRLYSGEVSGSVTVETKYPEPRQYLDYDRPFMTGPPKTSITIEGIHAYLIQYGDPNATKAIDQAREELDQ